MEAAVVAPTTAVVFLKEGEPGYLDQILTRLCALTDDEALKEGKAKGSSSFKLSTLKQIAKNMQLISGLAKPEMIQSLRNSAKTTEVLKNSIASKRDGTYVSDKNTYPRLINLVLAFPDALQRSSALATRQDLQNKEVNATRTIWTDVAEQFMDGHDSGGIMKTHEEFTRVGMDTEVISKNGIFTAKQGFDLFKSICRAYAIVKPKF